MADSIRLDKWLWAARFFKTRALAKLAITNGKVKIEGTRPKPSRDVRINEMLTIQQGFSIKVVKILQVSDQRRSAQEAALLYQETDESRVERQKQMALRKANKTNFVSPERPNKKNRRQIIRFKRVDE